MTQTFICTQCMIPQMKFRAICQNLIAAFELHSTFNILQKKIFFE